MDGGEHIVNSATTAHASPVLTQALQLYFRISYGQTILYNT